MQELFTFGWGWFGIDVVECSQFGRWMAELGLRYQSTAVGATPRLGQNSGLAVYSRLPAVAAPPRVFEQHRKFSLKGWQEVTVELSRGGAGGGAPPTITFINTHLEHAQSGWSASDHATAARPRADNPAARTCVAGRGTPLPRGP